MANDSIELGRIRAKVLRLEDKTDKLTIVDTTASFDQTVSITGNLYVNGELLNLSSADITSALTPYATSVNVSSSVSSSLTAALSPYATSTNVSSSVTSALSPYATSTNVSSSVTSSVNTLKTDLTASYARLAVANIFSANQTITGTLNASSNISGNANLIIGGNTGIGTTTALEKLHVVGNAIIGTTFNSANGYPSSDLIIHATDATSALGQADAISIFRQQSANSWPQIATMTIGRYELAGSSPKTRLDFNLKEVADGTDTAEVNVMSLNSAGKVGIGTTSPSSKLTVVDNGYPSVLISSSYAASSKVYSSIQFGASNTNGGGDIGFVHDQTTPANSFFHITPYGAVQGTGFCLGSDGNSGFGVANPFNKIHIDTTVANDGIYLNGNSSLWTSLRTNLGAGAYNSITNANDRGIIYGGASDGSPGGGFVIAPWATGPSGLRINENGNVGIGITNPATKLDVAGTIKSGRTDTANEGGEIQLARAFDNAVKWTIDAFGSGDSSAFRIFDNTGSVAFYINPTNRYVGLGGNVNFTPTVPVHIKNANSTYTNPEDNNLPTVFASNTSNASTSAHAILGTRVGGASGGDPFISFDISGVTGWSIGVDNSDSDKFKISNAWNDVGTNTDVTIQTNGNVGINTVSPNARLHVLNNGGAFSLEGTDHVYMQWYPDGNAAGRKAYTGFPSAAVDDFYIVNEILNADIILDPNGGNVGIDNTNPIYKLDVGGSLRATADSIINNNQIFSDNITINGGGSGNRYAYVDFVGDATYADYGLRVIRNNGGANTSSEIVHRGTGNFTITAGATAGEISNLIFFVNGAFRQVSDSAGDFRPYYTNDSKLGNSTYRWEELWLSNTSINPSDEREKYDIFNSDLGLEFIKKLRPVSYKWKSAKTIVSSSVTFDDVGNKIVNDTTSSLPGKRNHYGLIAQEVEQVLNGKDFAGFIRDQEADVYALRYGEFISPIIKAVQELSEENDYLKNKLKEKDKQIDDILSRLAALENK